MYFKLIELVTTKKTSQNIDIIDTIVIIINIMCT